MVQYILTPWRNHKELLEVRGAFYSSAEQSSVKEEQERRKAVARVAVWVQRGNCPHLVESTAILIAAMLNDTTTNEAYAIRAAYSTAFCRFVTGLLDGYQEGRQKLSMYSIAKNIGLPATFVELRHQCTHEELPSLSNLRTAVQKSLTWIEEHYWRDVDAVKPTGDSKQCRQIVQEYLQWLMNSREEKGGQETVLIKGLRRWTRDQLLDALDAIEDSGGMNASGILQAVKLRRSVMKGNFDAELSDSSIGKAVEKSSTSLDTVRAEMAQAKKILQEDSDTIEAPLKDSISLESEEDPGKTVRAKGWSIWQGTWTSKPIGIVQSDSFSCLA